MKLNKVVTVFSKIAEICYWVGTALTTVIVIGLISGHDGIVSKLSDVDLAVEQELTAFGFSISTVDGAGHVVRGSYVIFFLTMIFMFVLMAMICRNIYLIFKTTAGETKFSKGQTPFQPDNIRMVREIGYFLLAMPAVGLIMSIISNILYHTIEVESAMDMHFVAVGLVVICLSRFFSYGMELQNDVDGLV